jgi:3-oxoacyl-[acyl-carrier protein] reductase
MEIKVVVEVESKPIGTEASSEMSWAVVTGGSRGLGAAAAIALAEDGHDVLITFRRNRKAAEQAVSEIEQRGRDAEAVQLELDDLQAVTEFARQASKRRRPAVLVNNGGEAFPDALDAVSLPAAERLLRVNTLAPVALVQGLAVALASHDRAGAVINVSSVVACGGSPRGSSVYATSKSGLHGMTRTLAVELAPSIRVNAVVPGVFGTDMNAEALSNEKKASAAEALIPLGRVGTPEECAQLVSFLASPRASYVTGAIIPVDGGVLARLALP